MARNPSILSKLLQKLLDEFTPKKSLIAITATKIPKAPKIQENFGRYSLSRKARMTHKAKTISTMILNAKFFPVINGKSIDGETKKDINGMAKRPMRIKFLRILSACIIEKTIPEKYPSPKFVHQLVNLAG